MENLSQARDTDGCSNSGSEKNMKIHCGLVHHYQNSNIVWGSLQIEQ